jgi:hypothetical protein
VKVWGQTGAGKLSKFGAKSGVNVGRKLGQKSRNPVCDRSDRVWGRTVRLAAGLAPVRAFFSGVPPGWRPVWVRLTGGTAVEASRGRAWSGNARGERQGGVGVGAWGRRQLQVGGASGARAWWRCGRAMRAGGRVLLLLRAMRRGGGAGRERGARGLGSWGARGCRPEREGVGPGCARGLVRGVASGGWAKGRSRAGGAGWMRRGA